MKSEKILYAIGQIDDELIEDAVIQTPQKKKSLCRTPDFRRTVAITACVAAVVGLFLVILPQILDLREPQEQTNGMEDIADQGVVFDSLDKVNYYAGLKLVNQQNSDVFAPELIGPNGYSLNMFNNTSKPQGSYLDPGNENNEIKDGTGSENISREILCITTAIYFQLEVTHQDEFLAYKVGTGIVNVVITDLHIGINPFAMITFKNGDRYFSCLTEGRNLVEEENKFWTHLYINGFELFKDASGGVSHFNVVYDAQLQQVTAISWIPYNSKPEEASVYPISIIPESTKVSYATYEFTLFELAEFYNGNAALSLRSRAGADRSCITERAHCDRG